MRRDGSSERYHFALPVTSHKLFYKQKYLHRNCIIHIFRTVLHFNFLFFTLYCHSRSATFLRVMSIVLFRSGVLSQSFCKPIYSPSKRKLYALIYSLLFPCWSYVGSARWKFREFLSMEKAVTEFHFSVNGQKITASNMHEYAGG